MVWSVDIQGPNGGSNIATDVPFHGLRATKTVEGPGSIEIDLAITQIADYWQPGTHRVILNGDMNFAGYVTALRQAGRPSDGGEGVVFTASGLGLEYILDYRIVRHQVNYIDMEVSDMVYLLLDEAQDQDNGDMGFSAGTVHNGPTVTRTRDYCFGVVIGDAIRELASVGRGFDWAIDASGNLNIWDDTRGEDTGITFDPETITDYTIDFDTSQLVTTVSVIGAFKDPFGPRHDMVRDVGAAVLFGRHEIAIDVETDDPDEMLDAAHAELKVGKGGLLKLHCTWPSELGPWDLGDVGLQDTISVVLPDWYGGTTDMRCTDFSVSLEWDAQPHYWVEYSFDALVTQGEIEDGDPDA